MIGREVLTDERLRELLHRGECLGALDGRLPVAGEDVHGVVGGVGDGDGLMQVAGGAGELRRSGGGGDLAAVNLGAVGVVVEGGGHGLDAGAGFLVLLLLLVVRDVTVAERGAIGVGVGDGAGVLRGCAPRAGAR